MFDIFEVLKGPKPVIDIVDVGAMFLSEQDLAYRELAKVSGLTRVIGFEPVQAECDKLNAMNKPGQRFLPYFIGDGRERTFYENNFSATSSLYEPRADLCSKFQNLEELMRPIRTHTVQTRRLDDLPEIRSMDLLKIDVQGAELDVFRGATRLLKNCLAIQTEVEFVAMYKDQPLFADIDTFLRSQGFVLHTFLGLMGRAFKPLMMNNNPNNWLRQVLWTDAVYVRDFMKFEELAAEQLIKLAIMTHAMYQSFDLAQYILQVHDKKVGTRLWDAYMNRLTAASLQRAGAQGHAAPPGR